MTDSTERVQRSIRRIAVAAVSVVALVALYALRPRVSSFTTPENLRALAEPVLSLVDVTTALVATVVLTVVAMTRRLPFGVAAVLLLVIGSTVSSAAVHQWVSSVPDAGLPNGYVVGVSAIYGAAVLVAAPQFKPAVAGLGAVAVLAITAAAVVAEPVALAGVAASLMITAIWWALSSVVMLYSPVAAQREELRPDTAAIAFSRYR
ncbi:hypothetical protein DW322_17485 [Rhodococcus rhodnii]|uniref:Uncharacterized protein n=2 Tax=Rhodococcus rhodnii TaxID=38312 RepID=R7WLN2_9NOCA|nr:hypothetical protein [Rhodococcus rhodnii]EOM74899.1 hypothetical protein Rrhod_3776 [Rhodococcus rhodnii LMG 5362]TXG91657.1 hypothetical protein DW322_17485 [Rhodococcus rhodnii]